MTQLLSLCTPEKGRYEVRILHLDVGGFVSLLAGLFSSRGMDIREAWMELSENQITDVFIVRSEKEPDWMQFEADLNRYVIWLREGKAEEVHSEINDEIIRFLRTHPEAYHEQIDPLQLSVDQESSTKETVIDIRSPDTPAFLYELTTALAVLGFRIRRMEIKTANDEARDRLWLTTQAGQKITSDTSLRILQWAILLIKHFTHLLPKVPDPARAREAIQLLGKDVFERDNFDEILLTLKDSDTIEDLSKVLGTSRFVWEEFIRFQNESIFQILGDRQFLKERRNKTEMDSELQKLLVACDSFPQKVEVLNEFKDREMFRIDLRHILKKTSFLGEFSEEFSDLAEIIVEQGSVLCYDEVLKKRPAPMVTETQKSVYSICALGKLGGRELGFASDIELMFVFTNDPNPESARSRSNLEFYVDMVQRFKSAIHARSEGVFEIDLRLRPFGKDGPLAVSFDLFKSYYSAQGSAQNFERQSLVKLRPVSGDSKLGEDILHQRDAFVFSGKPFDFNEAFELRSRQRKELVASGTLNAKYSQGGLLDVEYLIQTLQVIFATGDEHRALRSPNTLDAVEALKNAGILDADTCTKLEEAYVFFRALIDALRIARGNAKELTVPEWSSRASAVLARRMVYPAIDFYGNDDIVNEKMRDVSRRIFKTAGELYEELMAKLEREGRMVHDATSVIRESGKRLVSFSKVLAELNSEKQNAYLRQLGFSEPDNALLRLQRFSKNEYAIRLLDSLTRGPKLWWLGVPDADFALQYLERFSDLQPDLGEFWSSKMTSESLQFLLTVFGTSHYLSEILLDHPEYWSWLRDPREVSLSRAESILETMAHNEFDAQSLRTFRHRETLRIALCELLNRNSLADVYHAFSSLADFVIRKLALMEEKTVDYCVLGLGKLGGWELNFSSDIDIMFIGRNDTDREALSVKLRQLSHALGKRLDEGFLYRVDLRLRPNGETGALVLSLADTIEYYQKNADIWEYQMLLKARPVAGLIELGDQFIRDVQLLVFRNNFSQAGAERLREIKRLYEDETYRRGETDTHIKLGRGGIRDVEFSVQMIQLQKGFEIPELREANTLKALDIIAQRGFLAESDCDTLRESYLFWRRVENRIHLYENRQEFNIPDDPRRLHSLAKSMGFLDDNNLNTNSAENQFLAKVRGVQNRCRAIFERIFFKTS